MNTEPSAKFDSLFEKYNSMLYGIAIQIAPGEKEADEILIPTFVKAQQLSIGEQSSPSPFVALTRLLVQTGQEMLKQTVGETYFTLQPFSKTPLLHKLLSGQTSLEEYCIENEVSRAEAQQMLREELNLVRGRETHQITI